MTESDCRWWRWWWWLARLALLPPANTSSNNLTEICMNVAYVSISTHHLSALMLPMSPFRHQPPPWMALQAKSNGKRSTKRRRWREKKIDQMKRLIFIHHLSYRSYHCAFSLGITSTAKRHYCRFWRAQHLLTLVVARFLHFVLIPTALSLCHFTSIPFRRAFVSFIRLLFSAVVRFDE